MRSGPSRALLRPTGWLRRRVDASRRPPDLVLVGLNIATGAARWAAGSPVLCIQGNRRAAELVRVLPNTRTAWSNSSRWRELGVKISVCETSMQMLGFGGGPVECPDSKRAEWLRSFPRAREQSFLAYDEEGRRNGRKQEPADARDEVPEAAIRSAQDDGV
jgi:hypothetical protein